MEYFTNNIRNGNFVRMSEYQLESNKTQATQKKKQIVSEREGKYYCTYIIDENGKKFLINKVPVAQVEEQKISGKPLKSDAIINYYYSIMKNDSAVFECKQNMRMEAAHKENLHEIMDLLKEEIGIKNDPQG